ncbi:hypothetical protein N7530_000914 [Penicillium desertorum]|uniref:Uncharacterized protein n=1 Tax=Penicillium desertorum TaxID=1303715 RepID=A0A9X0BVV1_9EURO|nr:hypothetical protein N7530_000914 [Penicillium desertorum]
MRNAPPDTRCVHEDERKGCESMRSFGQGLSTEKSIREVRPRLQEKMENQTVWHRPKPLPSRSRVGLTLDPAATHRQGMGEGFVRASPKTP